MILYIIIQSHLVESLSIQESQLLLSHDLAPHSQVGLIIMRVPLFAIQINFGKSVVYKLSPKFFFSHAKVSFGKEKFKNCANL